MSEFLPEIESDMSVYHRESNIYLMEGKVFFRRAIVLAAYNGALAARMRRRARPAALQTQVAAPADEDAMWAAFRKKNYQRFLEPNEVPREISVEEGLQLLNQSTGGR